VSKERNQQYYKKCRTKEMAASHKYKQQCAREVLKRARRYYAQHRQHLCAERRQRYELAEPKPTDKYRYIEAVSNKLNNAKVLKAIVKAFKQQHSKTSDAEEEPFWICHQSSTRSKEKA